VTAGPPGSEIPPGAADHPQHVGQFEEIIDHGLGLTPLDALLEQARAAKGDPVQLAAVAHRMRQRLMSLQTIGDHIGMTRADVYLLLRNLPS
jgi:hypothetical protein